MDLKADLKETTQTKQLQLLTSVLELILERCNAAAEIGQTHAEFPENFFQSHVFETFATVHEMKLTIVKDCVCLSWGKQLE